MQYDAGSKTRIAATLSEFVLASVRALPQTVHSCNTAATSLILSISWHGSRRANFIRRVCHELANNFLFIMLNETGLIIVKSLWREKSRLSVRRRVGCW